MRAIAALYCLPVSVYHSLPGVDVWDKARDATGYSGRDPVIAHPPCAQWSRLRKFAKVDEREKVCGLIAIEQVRRSGGVLEHPQGSALWAAGGLPACGGHDAHGFTIGIEQREFGHPCRKRTLLYVVGVAPGALPEMPLQLAYAERAVSAQHSGSRSDTPLELAEWLVELARRVQ